MHRSVSSRGTVVSRRRFVHSVVTAAGGLALVAAAGCSSPAASPQPTAAAPAAANAQPTAAAAAATQPSAASAATAKPAAGNPTVIHYMNWGGKYETDTLNAGFAQVMKQQPNLKIEYTLAPQNYDAKLQTMLAAGNAPDVFKISSDTYPDYVDKGTFLDITSQITKDSVLGQPDYFIMPFEKDRSTINGHWYAIGSCAQFECLTYNADVLKKAGVEPPSVDPDKAWTWQQFIEAGQKLTVDESGKHPNEAGFDVDRVAQWGLYIGTDLLDWQEKSMIYANGAQFIDPSTKQYTLDQPEVYEVLQNFADLVLKYHVSPRAATLQNGAGMDSNQMLGTGRLAISMDGNWVLQTLQHLKFTYGAGVPPKMKKPATVMSSSFTGIYKSTKQPEEAWTVFRSINLDSFQIPLCKSGLFDPSHRDLLTPEGVKKWLTKGVHPEGWDTLVEKYKLQDGHALPNILGQQKAATILTNGFDAVWTGEKTAKQACLELNPKVNKVLAEAQGG